MPSFKLNSFIIENVRKNKFIYDKTDVLYKNVTKKKELWTSLSETLKMDYNFNIGPEIIEKRWMSLRDMFSREGRRKRLGQRSRKEWVLYKDLLFLSNYITRRKNFRSSDKIRSKPLQINIPNDTSNDTIDTIKLAPIDPLELWPSPVDNSNSKEMKIESSIVRQMVEVSNVVSTSIGTLSKLFMSREKHPYVAAIEEGLKRVPIKNKTQCYIELLEVINKYELIEN